MKLNKFKRELLEREFPFLRKLDGGNLPSLEDVSELSVKKADNNLLSFTPWEDSYSWSGGGHTDYEHAAAIIGDQWVSLNSSVSWATGSGDRGSSEAESIGAQLRELKVDPQFIIIWTRGGLDDNGNGELKRTITIYKVKDAIVLNHCKAQLRRAYKEIMAELEAAEASS